MDEVQRKTACVRDAHEMTAAKTDLSCNGQHDVKDGATVHRCISCTKIDIMHQTDDKLCRHENELEMKLPHQPSTLMKHTQMYLDRSMYAKRVTTKSTRRGHCLYNTRMYVCVSFYPKVRLMSLTLLFKADTARFNFLL